MALQGNVNEVQTISGTVAAVPAGSSAGGTTDHSQLSNRDAADQHPIEAITGLKEILDKVETSPGGNADQSGLTAEQISALDGMFKICAYTADATDAYKAFKTAFGIGGEVEPEEPDVPEKTLTSISAVYSGGSVTAGTAVNDLTDIVVTAHYSDGTSKIVTDYTLSGEIAEGSNAITVSYGGVTATFNVTGIDTSPSTLRGLQLQELPDGEASNDYWTYTGWSGNLATAFGTSKQVYSARLFTGTVWIRCLHNTPNSSTCVNMYTVAEDYFENQTTEATLLTASSTVNRFDDQYLMVSSDGTKYIFSPSTYMQEEYPAAVKLVRYDIPDGQYAILISYAKGTANFKNFYVPDWFTVFFEDPSDNITCTEVVE